MDAIALGPLVLPLRVIVVLCAILVATGLAEWLRRRRGVDAGNVLWTMIATGFITARAVFVARHHDIYLAAPWSAFDIRDGGFEAAAGLVAACVVGAELTRRQAPLRRPLLACVLAGCAAWGGGALLNGALMPARAPLPDLTVRTLDGRAIALHGFAGKPVVLNLWASWCPPCRREMPAFAAAQAARPDITFVFANQGESAAAVSTYLARQTPAPGNVVLDPAAQLARRTNSPGYPTTLFYDARGKLVLRHAGELSAATLREKLAQLQD